MKKRILLLGGIVLALVYVPPVQAQSLKDILNSEAAQKILNTVKQANALQFEDLVGTWQYKSPACQFKSDELLQKAGGVALAESMEKKLGDAYAKAGIKPGSYSYTFNSDSTFVNQIGKKKLKGTYSYDVNSGKLVLKYYSLLASELQIAKAGETISLLFNADRLLQLVTWISSHSNTTALKTINKVAEQYDGMLLGYDMTK